MAGTLTISTLSDGTNSTSATNCIQGSAKAWVNFNGTTATPSTIRASYNVTSITKNGTGDYTVNFTNALADANYAVIASSSNDGSNNAVSINTQSTQGSISVPTTTSVRMQIAKAGVGYLDATYVNVSVFR
jgi:hypothetical protein